MSSRVPPLRRSQHSPLSSSGMDVRLATFCDSCRSVGLASTDVHSCSASGLSSGLLPAPMMGTLEPIFWVFALFFSGPLAHVTSSQPQASQVSHLQACPLHSREKETKNKIKKKTTTTTTKKKTTVDVVPAKLAAHFPVWATTPANLQWHPLLFYSDSFSVVQPKAKAKKRRKTTNARCSHPTAQQQRTNTHLFPLPLFETWHFWQRTSLAAMAQRL